jgi:hypothetical protein
MKVGSEVDEEAVSSLPTGREATFSIGRDRQIHKRLDKKKKP